MSRMIDADALMEKLGISDECNSCFFSRKKIYCSKSDDFVDACEAIANAPTIEPEPHWIPCEERLPENGERVLATHLGGLNPDRQVIEHIYKNGKFTLGWDMDMNMDSPTFGQRYMGKVVAWMPLPEPYREGES